MPQAGTLFGLTGQAFAYIGTAPAATQTLTVNTLHPTSAGGGTVILTQRGVISVSTLGIVTFPVFGDIVLSAGDTVQLVNQNPADTTFADSCFTYQYQLN